MDILSNEKKYFHLEYLLNEQDVSPDATTLSVRI